MADNREPTTIPATPTARARRFFYGALALFLLWVAALIVLAIVSGHHPMERAGAIPSALAPGHDHDHAEPARE